MSAGLGQLMVGVILSTVSTSTGELLPVKSPFALTKVAVMLCDPAESEEGVNVAVFEDSGFCPNRVGPSVNCSVPVGVAARPSTRMTAVTSAGMGAPLTAVTQH